MEVFHIIKIEMNLKVMKTLGGFTVINDNEAYICEGNHRTVIAKFFNALLYNLAPIPHLILRIPPIQRGLSKQRFFSKFPSFPNFSKEEGRVQQLFWYNCFTCGS